MLLADAYFHRMEPFAIRITEGFGIRWYGLAYLAGFVIAWAALRWLARRERIGLTVAQVGDLMLVVVLGVLIGGRLGYALFYDPTLFLDFSGDAPFWGLLAINKGGMASHGGIAGVILAFMFYARRHGLAVLHLLDLASALCPAGLFLGRIANFVNAELWGRALPPSMQANPPSWGVKYPEEILLDSFQRAEEVREQLGPIVTGDATFLTNVVAAARDADAPQHAEVVAALKPLLTAYYPSQLIQAITDGPLLFLLLAGLWLAPRKPGVIGGWFLIGYGAMRIATEAVRQPDAGVGLVLGLSRGQQLSILMIASGIVGLAIVLRRAVPKTSPLRSERCPYLTASRPAPSPTAPRGSRGAA
jgi:phosphatidylglycerol:prolipoprotein diacylglycerol transferase